MMIRALLIFALLASGCSSLKRLVTGDEAEDYNALTYGKDYRQSDRKAMNGRWSSARQGVEQGLSAGKEQARTTASQKILDPTEDRVRREIENGRGLSVDNYRLGDRATRQDFLDNVPHDGSLWANDNDANYFFTKEKLRTPGDIISVKLEEPMIRLMAEEVKKSLTPAEQEVEMALYLKNNQDALKGQDLKAYRELASEGLQTSGAEDVMEKMEKAVLWSQVDLKDSLGVAPNEELRAEVIDRFHNGNYKIRAVRRVLYRGASKMISFVAVAPAGDFNETDIIPSGKLYEHKIEVYR